MRSIGRGRVLGSVLIAVTLASAWAVLGSNRAAAAADSSAGKSAAASRKIAFNDPSFDFEFRRAIGYTASGGAGING